MTTGADVAVLAHGAGSTPDAVARLLGPAASRCTILTVDARGTVDDVVGRIADLASALDSEGRRLALVGGLSFGAHAAASWSMRHDPAGQVSLVLAMPAWTGPPDEVAALTASSADEIEREGTAGILARVVAESGGDWVVDELVRAWTGADPVPLARALRDAASSSAPTRDELARIRAHTVVVALADDPLHPSIVAAEWADAIPGARLVTVARDAPNHDRGALGRAARAPANGSR